MASSLLSRGQYLITYQEQIMIQWSVHELCWFNSKLFHIHVIVIDFWAAHVDFAREKNEARIRHNLEIVISQ